MYFQAYVICTSGSDMKLSLDFWQKHIKIFSPLLRGTKVTVLNYIHTYILPLTSPQRGFSGPMKRNERNDRTTTKVRIPTGRKQTNWLCTAL